MGKHYSNHIAWKRRKIHGYGVSINGDRYYHPDMEARIGQPVNIRFDHEPATAMVFSEGKEFLFRARITDTPQPGTYPGSEGSQAARAAMEADGPAVPWLIRNPGARKPHDI